MAMAFVLVNSEIGTEERVLAALKSIDAVKKAFMVYGVYDIVVKIVTPSMDILRTTVLSQIRELADVRSTLTLIVAEDTT